MLEARRQRERRGVLRAREVAHLRRERASARPQLPRTRESARAARRGVGVAARVARARSSRPRARPRSRVAGSPQLSASIRASMSSRASAATSGFSSAARGATRATAALAHASSARRPRRPRRARAPRRRRAPRARARRRRAPRARPASRPPRPRTRRARRARGAPSRRASARSRRGARARVLGESRGLRAQPRSARRRARPRARPRRARRAATRARLRSRLRERKEEEQRETRVRERRASGEGGRARCRTGRRAETRGLGVNVREHPLEPRQVDHEQAVALLEPRASAAASPLVRFASHAHVLRETRRERGGGGVQSATARAFREESARASARAARPLPRNRRWARGRACTMSSRVSTALRT